MPNAHFEPAQRAILGAAERWRLISTLVPAEVSPIARRERVASHAHPHQEVLIPLSGRAVYALGDRVYPCTGGTVFFFDRFEPHDNGYSRDIREAVHLWVSIVEDGAVARTLCISEGRISAGAVLAALSPASIGLDLQKAIGDARHLAATAPGLARTRLVGAIAAVVASLIIEASPALDTGPGSVQEQAIAAITRHIRQTAGNGVTLEHLARITGYSKFHFLRLFKTCTGRTVHQFVDDCRRERVAEWRAAGRSHKDIGENLGFSCPAAFSRWYRANGPTSEAGARTRTLMRSP